MSMRQSVGRQDIEHFLVEVGRTRQPGRIYIVGGAALIHKGIRPGQTLDIDIQITSDPANLTAQIAQLKQKLVFPKIIRPFAASFNAGKKSRGVTYERSR